MNTTQTQIKPNIYVIDGLLAEHFTEQGVNTISKCLFPDYNGDMDEAFMRNTRDRDPLGWQKFATVLDTKYFDPIPTSVQSLYDHGQKRLEINNSLMSYRKKYVQHVTEYLTTNNMIDLEQIRCIETWCNSGKKWIHIDRDESKTLNHTLKHKEFPVYSVITLPYEEQITGGEVHVLQDTTLNDIYNFFEPYTAIQTIVAEADSRGLDYKSLYYQWVPNKKFKHEMDNTDKILKYQKDRWVTIEAKPGRVILFPGSNIHFNSQHESNIPQYIMPRRSIPINYWGKVYGE